MKRGRFARAVIGLALICGLAVVSTGRAEAASASSGPPRSKAPDLITLHDASSPSFNKNCLSCHGDIMKKTTLNKKFKEAHAAMVPFMPGYDVKRGVTNKACVSCHGKVDLLEHSGEQIRRNANVSACVTCHNKSGPSSKKFYAN